MSLRPLGPVCPATAAMRRESAPTSGISCPPSSPGRGVCMPEAHARGDQPASALSFRGVRGLDPGPVGQTRFRRPFRRRGARASIRGAVHVLRDPLRGSSPTERREAEFLPCGKPWRASFVEKGQALASSSRRMPALRCAARRSFMSAAAERLRGRLERRTVCAIDSSQGDATPLAGPGQRSLRGAQCFRGYA